MNDKIKYSQYERDLSELSEQQLLAKIFVEKEISNTHLNRIGGWVKFMGVLLIIGLVIAVLSAILA